MNESAVSEKVGLPKSIIIAMIVAVSLPLLASIPGVLAFLASNLHGETRNATASWMTFLQNGFALFACVMSLCGTKQYWLPLTASVLTFVAWFWLSFSTVPLAWVFAGTLVSIGIGIWSFIVLRKPEVRSGFGVQFDPVDSIAKFVLPRLPKFKVEPTSGNISRASVLSLCSLCVVGILIGSLLGKGDTAHRTWQREAQPLVDLLNKSDGYWDAGKKNAAIEGYMQIISLGPYDPVGNEFKSDHKLDISRIYNRVVDYRVEQGRNPEALRDVVRNAVRERAVSVTFSNHAVAKIVSQERAAYSHQFDRDLKSSGGYSELPSGPEKEKSDSEKSDDELREEGRQMRQQFDKEHPGVGKMIEDTRDQLRRGE